METGLLTTETRGGVSAGEMLLYGSAAALLFSLAHGGGEGKMHHKTPSSRGPDAATAHWLQECGRASR